MENHKYDVALSFAGEDRPYVEETANLLKEAGVSVFYDGYERSDLWGKDLYAHLSNVYSEQSRFVVIFISECYERKLWASHERKSAQARAFRENEEYILPARFDDTEVPGIPGTIGFIDLRTLRPDALSKLIIEKVRNADYWKREAVEASEFSERVLLEAHRGAFLWRKDVTAIFENRIGETSDQYFLEVESRLTDINVLVKTEDEARPLIYLLATSHAHEVHELVWDIFEGIHPSFRAAIQRSLARGALGTVCYTPVKGSVE